MALEIAIEWNAPYASGPCSEPNGWTLIDREVKLGLSLAGVQEALKDYMEAATLTDIVGTTGAATYDRKSNMCTLTRKEAISCATKFRTGDGEVLGRPTEEAFTREVKSSNPLQALRLLRAGEIVAYGLENDVNCCNINKCPKFDKTKGMDPVIDAATAQAQIGALGTNRNQLCRKGLVGYNDPQQLAKSITISNLTPTPRGPSGTGCCN